MASGAMAYRPSGALDALIVIAIERTLNWGDACGLPQASLLEAIEIIKEDEKMFYDAHVHIGAPKVIPGSSFLSLPGYERYSPNVPEKFIKRALAKSVQRALIFPFPFPDHSISELNSTVLKATSKYPFFFTPLLFAKDVQDIEPHIDLISGVKSHFYLQGKDTLPNPEILDFLRAYNKVYLFHAHMRYWKQHIEYICKNFKGLNVIIAHGARMPFSTEQYSLDRVDEIASWIPSRKRSNFYFETSTVRRSSVIRKIIDTFGANHVLWGSDYPYYETKGEDVLQKEIETINEALSGVEEGDHVLHGNYRRLMGFELDIRYAAVSDAPDVLKMIDSIQEPDAGFLALHLKRQTIRSRVRKASHLLVARNRDDVLLGFLRWSDRPNRGMIIEEVYTDPDSRGMGIATKMITSICPSFEYIDAKTFASNYAIVKVFNSLGFVPTPTAKRTMINWRKR